MTGPAAGSILPPMLDSPLVSALAPWITLAVIAAGGFWLHLQIRRSAKRLGESLDRVGESVDRMGEGVDRMAQSLDRMGEGVDRMAQSLDRMEQRLDRTVEELDNRMDRMENRLDRTQDRLDRAQDRVADTLQSLEEIEDRAGVPPRRLPGRDDPG